MPTDNPPPATPPTSAKHVAPELSEADRAALLARLDAQARTALSDALASSPQVEAVVTEAGGWTVLLSLSRTTAPDSFALREPGRDCLRLLGASDRPLSVERVRGMFEKNHFEIWGKTTVRRALTEFHRQGLIAYTRKRPCGYYLKLTLFRPQPNRVADDSHPPERTCLLSLLEGQARRGLDDFVRAGAIQPEAALAVSAGWALLLVIYPLRPLPGESEGEGESERAKCARGCLEVLAESNTPLPAASIRDRLEDTSRGIFGLMTVRRVLTDFHQQEDVEYTAARPKGFRLTCKGRATRGRLTLQAAQ
jgi:Fe2+ or Zn2+ uptake regulation protein